jgi:RnfABCDGE-type electron transport complex B subunit
MMGEVLGMAASLCKKHNTNPRGIYQHHLEELKELMKLGVGRKHFKLELWNSAWPAGMTMLGLGTGFAVVLLIASRKLAVEVDPKIEQIHEVLPQIDCGACGFAGCTSYAKAVAEKPSLIGKCAPGGAETAGKIAEILNLQVSDSGALQRPIVHCRAHTNDRTYYATYQGIPTCISANALANVQACKFGCLGFGDCVSACKFDALGIVDGLAIVDYEKCTGCTACSKSCPRNLIEMVPFSQENMMTVACNSKENGKSTRSMCKVGCIACGLCVKQSEQFRVENNLARLDYEKYQPTDKEETAMEKCPTGVIIYVGKNAPVPRPPKQKPTPATA